MKNKNREIVVKLEILNDELKAIHALEIINNIITGIYYHAYLSDDCKYNDMYFLVKNRHLCGNYIQNFINFVGDSKLITYNDEFDKIKMYFENNIAEKIEITDLFRQCRNEGININSKSCHGGLIDCTVFARFLYDKNLKTKTIKMTGIYKKRKYYQLDELKEDIVEEEDDDEREEEEEVGEIKNKLYKGRFIVIDVDTTSLKRKNCRLIAINGVEVKDGKLTGIFFHTFINKRDYNYDFMYYLAEYNYCLKIKEKLRKFLDFVGDSIIVSHNINYDIGHINKELIKYGLPNINKKNCICTMKILSVLLNYKLKDCASFYKIYGIHDYHKGIVDATVLAFIVCKMGKNNDKHYNIYSYEKKDCEINKKYKIYISYTGKKYHLYSRCGNLICSERITIKKAKKIGFELCKHCKRKKSREINYVKKP